METDLLARVGKVVPSTFFQPPFNTRNKVIDDIPKDLTLTPNEPKGVGCKLKIGTGSVIQYRPGEPEHACFIHQFHYGALKYVPALSPRRFLLV